MFEKKKIQKEVHYILVALDRHFHTVSDFKKWLVL